MERSEFGDRQAAMTAQWYENVKRAHGDVDAYIATRHAAYLDRWKEAGRFIADGASVLDIGGGNLYDGLVNYLKDRKFRYHYRDVDYGSVHSAKEFVARLGLDAPSVEHGFNDELDFPDNSFDAVFSSHCIEHSIDLKKTFQELYRVIRPGGNLLMAVPFGWEMNPEHPYFLGPQEWIALVQDAGFDIRTAQIGFEYPEIGADYFISARKAAEGLGFRISPMDYCKDSFTFVPTDDPSIAFSGAFDVSSDMVKLHERGSSIAITAPGGAVQVLPIMHRHAWSGRVTLTSGKRTAFDDLYSWFPYDMPSDPVQLGTEDSASSKIIIELDGKSPVTRWDEAIFKGYMWR